MASASPRGLSMMTAGAPVAASSLPSRARPFTVDICGPAMMTGTGGLRDGDEDFGRRCIRQGRGPQRLPVLASPRCCPQSAHRAGPMAGSRAPAPPPRGGDADRFADVPAERRGRA